MYIEIDESMEMPTPCVKCGNWFDLHDGYGSEKWYPNTVICSNCHDEEEKEIECDEEIEELKSQIDEAKETISCSIERLAELDIDYNNSWIKLESKDDLPKTDGNYWVVEKDDKSPKIIRYTNNPYTKQMNDDWWLKYINHYQLIEVPNPPIH